MCVYVLIKQDVGIAYISLRVCKVAACLFVLIEMVWCRYSAGGGWDGGCAHRYAGGVCLIPSSE